MSQGPIALRGSLHETIWGGQHLATVAGKKLPPTALVGESWETALDSVAINSPYAGRTLEAITADLGVDLYGTRAREVCGDRFPLLAKFIDAHAWLSVQVHPDDAYAATHENGKLGKTEAWRILHVEPGAQIIHSLEGPTNRTEVEKAIREVRLEELTHRLPVHTGDVVLNLAGTLHATGAGVVLYEIQEYSDVTYRLYDYGRRDANGHERELHIEKGLDVLDYTPVAHHTQTPVVIDTTERMLVACRHFALSETRLTAEFPTRRATDGTSCHIITVIGGEMLLSWGPTGEPRGLVFGLGDTVVIPASLGAYHLSVEGDGSGKAEAVVLTSWVPMEGDARVSAWKAAQ